MSERGTLMNLAKTRVKTDTSTRRAEARMQTGRDEVGAEAITFIEPDETEAAVGIWTGLVAAEAKTEAKRNK